MQSHELLREVLQQTSAKQVAADLGLSLSMIYKWAEPDEGGGSGADRGVDGLLYFYESKDERRKIIVQVKGGGVKRNDVATLLGDVNNQKAAGGILLTLEELTKPMRDEAVDAGRYESRASGTTRIILKNAVESTQRRKGAKTQGFRLSGTFTRWVSKLKPVFPSPCPLRLCLLAPLR